jgi:MFS family permease
LAEASRFRIALGALIAMRIVYAINWLNIGAIFYAMAPDLGSGVVGLGTLTSSFYLGIGIFQVPGGVMAAKWGPRKIVILGTMVSSGGAFATAFAHDLIVASVLRFIVGGGMAFVFAPAVIIIARLLTDRRSGLGIGLFNSMFDVGGIFALFLWAVIAGITGWRPSLELSGGLGIVSGLVLLPTVPSDPPSSEFRFAGSQLWKVLADPRLLIIGLGMLAVDVGNVIVSSFMEYYLIGVYGLSTVSAGTIASMIVAVPIFTAIYAGRMYDRMKRPRFLMLVSNVVLAGSLVLAAFPSVAAATICTILSGLFSGFGFTVGFAAAKDFNRASKEYDSLAVAWVNCISLFGAFVPPLVFSYSVASSGYPQAWLLAALMTVLLTVPLLFLKEVHARAA